MRRWIKYGGMFAPRRSVETSLRTPDLVEGTLSPSWGRSPTCPLAIQDFPTGQVGDLPHQGSRGVPTSPTFPPATSGVRSLDTARRSACATLFIAVSLTAYGAGPADFGMAELNAAVDARNLRYKPKITTELNLDAPETFRIETLAAGGARISGGDLRGLMYGLLEAAGQIRTLGRLKLTHGAPAATPRGVRVAADPAAPWFSWPEFWRAYVSALARDRFDRLQLSFYRVPGSELYPALRMISQTGVDYGVDVVLGLKSWSGEFGPALQDLLSQCPAIHSVALNPGEGDGLREPLLAALAKTGRRVVLELRESDRSDALIETAAKARIPLRIFWLYNCGDGGDCSRAGAASRPRDYYWQVDPALAGGGPEPDAERVRSILTALGAGFEIPSPLGVNGAPDSQSIGVWGRLGYNPKPEPAPKAPAAKAPTARTRPVK